jgi:biopolymer transport protein ExbD
MSAPQCLSRQMLYNRANSLKRICKIDVTAFASVMVFLVPLMMFMPGNPHHGVGVDLPGVWHPTEVPHANRDDALMIAILRDGRVFFGNDRVSVEKLPAENQRTPLPRYGAHGVHACRCTR